MRQLRRRQQFFELVFFPCSTMLVFFFGSYLIFLTASEQVFLRECTWHRQHGPDVAAAPRKDSLQYAREPSPWVCPH